MSTKNSENIVDVETNIKSEMELLCEYSGSFGIADVRNIQKATNKIGASIYHEQIRQHGKFAVLNGYAVSADGFKGEKGVLGFGKAHGAVCTYKLDLRIGANWHNASTNNILFFIDGDHFENADVNEQIGKWFDWGRKKANITSKESYKDKEKKADYLTFVASRIVRDLPKQKGVEDTPEAIQVTQILPDKKSSNGMVKRIVSLKKWNSEIIALAKKLKAKAKNERDNEAEAEMEVDGIVESSSVTDAENRAKMYAIAIEKVLVIAKSDTVDSATKKAVLGLEAIIKTA